MTYEKPQRELQMKTVKLSFRLIVLGTLIILAVSIVGGIMSAYIFQPPLSPLTGDGDEVIATVQEVTISPGKAAAELVENSQRSVVLLAQETSGEPTALSIGIVLTNDGTVVSAHDIQTGKVVAIEETGKIVELTTVGRDEVYGLTYYRFPDGVFPPIELAQEDVPVGSHLLILGRSPITNQPRAETSQLYEYILPELTASIGVQRMIQLATVNNVAFPGDALLDDEGRLAGIVIDPGRGLALTAPDIRASLDRITTNKREFNPFEAVGFRLTYAFRYNADKTAREFVALIQAVTPGSPAAIGGLQARDVIQSINDEPVSWEINIAHQLSQELPTKITVDRAGTQHTFTVSKPQRAG